MANARLKQARRRASARAAAAAQHADLAAAHTPPRSAAESGASTPRHEPFPDAQSEREALQRALLERRRALETQLAALTLGRPLAREPAPSRARCQRDFLLQEMEWMAADFAQERKWRLRSAKALSQALVSHLDRQEARAARQQKSEQLARRRAAARVGRDVKKFWSKIDRVIAFKVKLQADELRQRHMQRHLAQLVAQTERYAQALAASFQGGGGGGGGGEEEEEEEEEEEDADFELLDEQQDDETTIEEEEQRSGPVSRRQAEQEVAALQQEAELSIDELRARYAHALAGAEEEEAPESDQDVDMADEEEAEAGDGDFVPTRREEEDQADDETTIEEEERMNGGASPSQTAEELRLLQEEGDMSIEQLRARYAAVSDDEDGDGHQSSQSENGRDAIETHREQERPEDDDTKADVVDLSASATTDTSPARKSGYKRPYLLTSRLDLREYQEAGVNWLISMCERRINGILADEMGLGKTIQTISLLAHLACAQGLWGPHLIVVPTSCLVNWEMEFKRWCPAFKVLTYFGSAKRRKELRQGWSKQNAFQVCITSYQLVVQDAHCFKRKKWYYLILDEAHNIKNWKSLRWQTLLTFSSQRRLLLTGTPLQNNLLELWALMHFLMPHVFASRKEFSYWFQNPLALMVENGSDPTQQGDNGVEGGKDLVTQLHGIIRPFVLRRLKKDVAKQLPGKFEHVISCQLSKRQRFLYEDFISRSSTRRAMFGRGKGRGANFMSMMNVLMQLRKVCNHPDLFEPRPIASPLDMPSIHVHVPSRCGYLIDEFVNERPRVALWAGNNLPGLELLGSEKHTSKRRRELFFYDVSAPLPADTVATVPTAYEGKKDLVRRIMKLAAKRREYWVDKRASVAQIQNIHIGLYLDEPVFGDALIRACTMPMFISPAMEVHMHRARPFLDAREPTQALQAMVRDPEERLASLQAVVNKSVCYVPKARARPARVIYGGGGFVYDDNFVLSRRNQAEELEVRHARPIATRILAPYHNSFKRTQLFFPDKALVQFDCGKLQQLAVLLRTLKRGGHRCLIFTQMSSMLNILEVFLNLHGHTYFRLDGATKVDKRQMLMERFNRDEKIFCFILSTRSGGLGINLTGADAVIFYDSDWNPAMDAQAQDRAHRIGQTRDVHIYRLVSEHTVEENILRKAQQKRHLDFLVMSEGQFTTDFFSKASLRELMVGSTGEEPEDIESESEVEDEGTDEDVDDDNEVTLDTVENAMAQLEDEEDVVAMKGARAEFLQEQNEFDEDGGGGNTVASPRSKVRLSHSGDAVSSRPSTPSSSIATSDRGDDEEDEFGNDETAEEDTAEEVDAPVRKRSRRDSGTPDASEHDESMDDDDDNNDDVSAATSNRKRQRRSSKHTRKTSKRRRMSEPQDHHGKNGEKVREKARDAAEEQKLQAWKASVSSLQGFEDSLNPVDRYALHFREDIDPLYAYTPAQQAEALAGIDSNPSAPTLLEDIEQTEAEKREEEVRLIAEGELVVGQMDEDDEIDSEQMTEHYTELYRRERAHVLFERRKRLLTGEAWSLMKCVNTGQPFYFNSDTREATWECPPVWAANDQFKSAQKRGYEGLPPPALQRVMAMLSPFPERHRVQMVCRSWHTAAQHQSLFVKVCASDFEPGSPESLAKVLAEVAPGDTVLFGAGVYQLEEPLEISKSLRLLATPDSHVELQMRSCRAQLRWSARGGVICGFHFSRTSRTPDSSALEITPSSDANESAPAVKESRRAMRKKDKKLANWQHLLSVVGDGQLRVEYCEFDGNGLGNACVCVWGRSEQKKKKRKKKRGVSSNVSTPLVATPVSTTPTAGTPRETTPTSTTATASAVVTTTVATPKIAATAVPPASVTPRVTTPVPTGITPPVPPASVPAVPNASTPATTTARITTPAAAVTSLSAVVKALTPATTASVVGPATAPAEATTTPHVATPVTATFVTNTLRSTPPGVTPATTTPRIIAAPATATTSTKMVPAADTLLVLQNCRIRGAGSSGVLLMRGSLVMSMNTVEGNGHSGVTVLGGQALLRRNKIQRNARFGLRLLYHAGNVIVEDNVVFGNACGNLDVDNSGRRFVVRLNDMDKGKKSTEKLPHSHGKLRLKTYRVLEKEVPRRQPSAPKPVVASAMSEYWRRQLAGAGGATATSTSLGSAPFTAASARPVITANAMMAAGIPMGFMRPVVFPPGAHVSHLPMAFASLGAKPTIPTVTLNRSTTTTQPTTTVATLQRTVSAPGIATAAARNGALHTPTTVATTTATKSGALPTSTSVATTMNTGALPTSTSVVTSTAVSTGALSTSTSVAASTTVRTGALPTSTSITTTTAAKTAALPTPTSVATTTTSIALTTTSLIEPPKKRRKRRPKTEQIIVGGREIVLRDTCEKVTEKVVKPRRPKEQQPQTPSIAPSLLQQMTSPSALQLKFAPGSTAAAVAAAMSAMMANTAKMQAVASSQLQSVGSVTMTANAATPKPAGSTTLPVAAGLSAAGASLAAAKPAVATASLTQSAALSAVAAKAGAAKPAVTAPSSTPVPGLLTTIAPAVAATPAVPVLPGTVAKPVVAKPKESTKPGEKRKLEAADTEAKPTTHEKASAGTTNGQTAKK